MCKVEASMFSRDLTFLTDVQPTQEVEEEREGPGKLKKNLRARNLPCLLRKENNEGHMPHCGVFCKIVIRP